MCLNVKYVDKVMVDRVVRLLNTYEMRFQLPENVFASSMLAYRMDHGFRFTQSEGN